LIGMFIRNGDVAIGAEALGYSAAGTIAFVIFGTIIWRSLRLLRVLISKQTGTKDVDSNADKDPRRRAGRRNTVKASAGDTTDSGPKPKPAKRSRKRRVFMWLMRNPLVKLVAKSCFKILLYMVWIPYAIFEFFFGSLVLKVALYLLLKMIKINIPDRLVEDFWEFVVTFLTGKSEKHAEDEEEQGQSSDEKVVQSFHEDEKLEVQSPLGPVNLRRSKDMKRAKTWHEGEPPERKGTQPPVTHRFARTPAAPGGGIGRPSTMQFPARKEKSDGHRASK
jgi:hypothetical protein